MAGGNMVIVRFYYNFRFEEGANVGLKISTTFLDPEREALYRVLTFRVAAATGSYQVDLINDGAVIPPAFTRTVTLAHNATAANIATALEAEAEAGPGQTWEFVPEGDEAEVEGDPLVSIHTVRVYELPTALFPKFAVRSGTLAGYEVGAWDEYIYEVPVTLGPIGSGEEVTSEIEPTGASSTAIRPRPRPSSKQLEGAAVQDKTGVTPFPNYSPPINT